MGPLDQLYGSALEDWLSAWCGAHCETRVPTELLDQNHNTISTRSVFFKSCPPNSVFLDMGAGNGSLATYKVWPPLERRDIKLYGVSLEPIEKEAEYTGVSISNFEEDPSPFGDLKFDGVMASHFIEHLTHPRPFLEWLSRSVKPGGRIYLEWPHPFTKRMPSRSFFIERGVPVFTTRFDDDNTHVEAWPTELILQIAETSDLAIETSGRIVHPYLACQLRDAARDMKDMVRGTFAVWSAVGWAQYMILTKPGIREPV